MNNILKLTITGLLVGYISLPLPQAVQAAPALTATSSPPSMLAEKDSETVPDAKTPKASKDKGHAHKKHASEILGFTLQNTVNNGQPLDLKQLQANPLTLLQSVKNSLNELLQQHGKPLQVNSNIKMLVSEKIAKELGELPTLTIKTNIDAQGKGQSDLTIPEFRITDKKSSLNWQGLTGQLLFPEKFDTLSVALKAAALNFEETGKTSISISPITLNSILDADLLPTEGDFSVPALKLKVVKDKDEVEIKDVTLNFKTDKTSSGLVLGSGSFKIGHISATEQATSKFLLDGLELSSNKTAQDDLVKATLHTQINQIVVNDVTPGENLEMSYASDLEIRRIDVQVALEMQKMMLDLQKQLQAGTLSEEMLGFVFIGKFMELTPKLLAKSPEVSLSQLNLKTKEGELRGGLTISVDGKKVTALDFNHFLTGIQAQADFSISKLLLEKALTMAKASKHHKPQKGEVNPTQQIQSLLKQKILVDAGEDNYKLSAIFQDSKLTLNGQEMPLPFLAPDKHGEYKKGEGVEKTK